MSRFVDETSSTREIGLALSGRLPIIATAQGSNHQFRVSKVKRTKGRLMAYNPSSGWHIVSKLWTTK